MPLFHLTYSGIRFRCWVKSKSDPFGRDVLYYHPLVSHKCGRTRHNYSQTISYSIFGICQKYFKRNFSVLKPRERSLFCWVSASNCLAPYCGKLVGWVEVQNPTFLGLASTQPTKGSIWYSRIRSIQTYSRSLSHTPSFAGGRWFLKREFYDKNGWIWNPNRLRRWKTWWYYFSIWNNYLFHVMASYVRFLVDLNFWEFIE